MHGQKRETTMANKPKRGAKPVQPGKITLYEGMLKTVGDIQPQEERERIARVLLLLLACAEDDRLNMNKVAELLTKLSGGKFAFQHEGAETAESVGDDPTADVATLRRLAQLICEFLVYFTSPKGIEEFTGIAQGGRHSVEQIAAAAFAEQILLQFHVTSKAGSNGHPGLGT
jgi:hypothetical protein